MIITFIGKIHPTTRLKSVAPESALVVGMLTEPLKEEYIYSYSTSPLQDIHPRLILGLSYLGDNSTDIITTCQGLLNLNIKYCGAGNDDMCEIPARWIPTNWEGRPFKPYQCILPNPWSTSKGIEKPCRVAVLNFQTSDPDTACPNNGYGTVFVDLDQERGCEFATKMVRDECQVVDFVIVLVEHGELELKTTLQQFCHDLADAGADFIGGITFGKFEYREVYEECVIDYNVQLASIDTETMNYKIESK